MDSWSGAEGGSRVGHGAVAEEAGNMGCIEAELGAIVVGKAPMDREIGIVGAVAVAQSLVDFSSAEDSKNCSDLAGVDSKVHYFVAMVAVDRGKVAAVVVVVVVDSPFL